MRKAMNKKSGFTLVELMIVVIIVGILAAVAVPMMSANKTRAIGSEAIAALGTLNTAARLFEVGTGDTSPTVAKLIAAGYVNATDLEGTYFTSTEIQKATWDGTNEKFQGTFSDGTDSHAITWDTTINSYKNVKAAGS